MPLVDLTWNGPKAIIIVWVDDMIIAATNDYTLNSVKSSLCHRIEMKDLGKLNWFLGIEFKWGKDYVEMNQEKYLEKVLCKFKMEDCKTKATPCELGSNKVKDEDSTNLADVRLYREIVGSLIYCMTATRPGPGFQVELETSFAAQAQKT